MNATQTADRKGTALVTGASSGIGALYADRLARQGYDLILVARGRASLDELGTHLTRHTPQSVEVMVADLGKSQDILRVETRLRTDPTITMLVNNAGVGALGTLLESDVDKMEQMIALNVNAVMRLSFAAVPGFVQRGGGAIINIASVLALRPELFNGVYAASKAFVLAFSQSLRHELSDKGVRVQVVLPGATATKFWRDAGTPVEQLPSNLVMSGEDMVDAALAGFDLGEFATVPSLLNVADWDAFEAARAALAPDLSHAKPAPRYLASTAASLNP